MIILTYGDLKPRSFVCSNCGSEFIADCSEYLELDEYFNVTCPVCHHLFHALEAPRCYQPLPKRCMSCGSLTHCMDTTCKYFETLTKWRKENVKSV